MSAVAGDTSPAGATAAEEEESRPAPPATVSASVQWFSAIFMLAGGVCWAVSGLMCWVELPCALPAVAGSVAYLVSVACQLYDWFLIRRSGNDAVYGRKVLLARAHTRSTEWFVYVIDYYLISSLLFLFGIFGDLFTTYHSEVNDDVSFASTAYLFSSLLWLLSSFVDMAQTLVDAHCRRRLHAVVQVSYWRTRSDRLVYSWEMAQALTFMIANIAYLTSAGLCYEDVGFDDACYALDFTGGVIFILNALCMMCAIAQPRATDVNPATLSLLSSSSSSSSSSLPFSIQDNDNDQQSAANSNNDVRRQRRKKESTSADKSDNDNDNDENSTTEQSIISKIQFSVVSSESPTTTTTTTTTVTPSISLQETVVVDDDTLQNIELDELR